MPAGGPQATRIPENPVRTSGIDPGGAPRRRGERPGPGRAAGLLLPPIAVMALIWVLSAQPHLSSGLDQDFLLRKCAHATEYLVLTLLWARAVGAAARPALHRRAPAAAAAIALALLRRTPVGDRLLRGARLGPRTPA